MLSTGCQSTRTKTVYAVPEIAFPEFPLAEGMARNSDGTVSVPAEWIIDLEEYHIRIEATESLYGEIKRIYSEINKERK